MNFLLWDGMASYHRLYAKFISMMSSKCSIVENDDELMLMTLHAHFLRQQQYSRLYAFFLAYHAFIDEDASFFHIVLKITNIRSWRYLSSSTIRVVASVVQAYTQPYSFILNDVSEMFNYCERRWIDVDGVSRTLFTTAAIFSVVRSLFGFSRICLSMRMPISFTFFTIQRTYRASLLHNISQRCTIVYTTSGRLKIIICLIRHKLNVLHTYITGHYNPTVRITA